MKMDSSNNLNTKINAPFVMQAQHISENFFFFLFIYLFLVKNFVGSQIVAHTQMETGDGPNKPNTINL